ncbi:MAG: HNH endonuclease [Planctomycetaceae bacterium]
MPWRANVKRRADPRNGIALHALFDRAFDRGLIAFDEQLHVLISRRLSEELRAECPTRSAAAAALFSIEGRQLNLPDRFRPDPTALSWHRATVFLGL